eukprot:NODE_18220_length_904_cov_3.296010.p1 GENE.NODE_18220_length_904_cov_3.296010~~NODE_18220_length_904_cov_3.296010.p1  ORF type:complete len:171 (+),score=19.62 NODE_18220_length_904_cov_3.296010:78-590(+)
MEGGPEVHRHTMWGEREDIDDGSSSSSKQHDLRLAVIPAEMDVLHNDSDCSSDSIANDRGPSSAAKAMYRHREGTCAPCRFHIKVGGCLHGDSCHFCHEPHDAARVARRARQPRPNKTVRARCKVVVDAIASTGLTLRDGEGAPTNPSVRTSYLSRLMKVKQQSEEPASP